MEHAHVSFHFLCSNTVYLMCFRATGTHKVLCPKPFTDRYKAHVGLCNTTLYCEMIEKHLLLHIMLFHLFTVFFHQLDRLFVMWPSPLFQITVCLRCISTDLVISCILEVDFFPQPNCKQKHVEINIIFTSGVHV